MSGQDVVVALSGAWLAGVYTTAVIVAVVAVRRLRREPAEVALLEEGRRLASEREGLVAAGVDPAELAVPLAPVPVLPDPGRGREL